MWFHTVIDCRCVRVEKGAMFFQSLVCLCSTPTALFTDTPHLSVPRLNHLWVVRHHQSHWGDKYRWVVVGWSVDWWHFPFHFWTLSLSPFFKHQRDCFHSLPIREEHSLWLQHLHQGATDDDEWRPQHFRFSIQRLLDKNFNQRMDNMRCQSLTFEGHFNQRLDNNDITNKSSKFDFWNIFQPELSNMTFIFFLLGVLHFPTLGLYIE